MNTLRSSARGALVWIVPFAILALMLGWQTDWGRSFGRAPPAEAAVTPQPLSLALLPEYTPSATLDKNKDMVERTLFTPTRRPAPVAMAEAAKPRMQRGQFTLAGTIVAEGKTTVFLKEVQGGKSRRVGQGETINGMTVAAVGPDRVKLVVGDESEDLVLKVAAGPRTTIQPVIPNMPVTASATPVPGAGGAPVRDVADILAERRRAARALEQQQATGALPPGTPVPTPAGVAVTAPNMPPVPQGDMNSGDPRWQSVYQRYQQPRGR